MEDFNQQCFNFFFLNPKKCSKGSDVTNPTGDKIDHNTSHYASLYFLLNFNLYKKGKLPS